jgi:glycosyltransferase involved in cell wall biosynthesis
MVAAQMDGFWNLVEIFDHQLRLRGMTFADVGKNYLMSLARPQAMTDAEINILYNACDIGINTCEGEGFGLCQFEHAAVGGPQVVPAIGGFREFLHPAIAILAEPKFFSYVDKSRDQVGGYAESADPKELADGVWKYYMNPALVTKHGRRARKEILQHYRWETVCGHFHKVLGDIACKK